MGLAPAPILPTIFIGIYSMKYISKIVSDDQIRGIRAETIVMYVPSLINIQYTTVLNSCAQSCTLCRVYAAIISP